MATRRRTEVTISTREVVVVRGGESPRRAWCPNCAAERIFVSPEEAAGMAGVSARLIYRCVEQGQLHFIENGPGALLICGESLPKAVRSLEGGTRK